MIFLEFFDGGSTLKNGSGFVSVNPAFLFGLYVRGRASFKYAEKRGGPGIAFARFGRKIGRRLLLKGYPPGLAYLLTPVNIVRYFEFPFVLSCLPERPLRCLDVSSPRLFSLYMADRNPFTSILMINPDSKDASQTTAILSKLKLPNVRVECRGVDRLAERNEKYDCIWSISVVEHISGDYDDRKAVQLMYNSLNAGGRLILTVPVDRAFRDEFRDRNYYGTQADLLHPGRYFFQHIYDKTAVWERLLRPLGKEPSVVRWFGEITPGRFTEYETRWMRNGLASTVEDAREIVDHYREFTSWEEMPGMGVCGLMIEKTSP